MVTNEIVNVVEAVEEERSEDVDDRSERQWPIGVLDAVPDVATPADRPQLGEEFVDEAALPDAGFARQQD